MHEREHFVIVYRAPSATAATTVAATAAIAATAATGATAAPQYYATMASLRVLAFNHEGRPVQFDTWLDDLQLYLLSDIKDGVSLFDHVSGAATAPPTTADSATRSQWLSRDAAPCLAIRNHLPLAECAHFGQHRTAQTLYDAVVARYSSPATATLCRLLLPYLFPELSAFATVEDLVSHLRISDARYRAAVPPEFLDRNQPPMFITLYFIVTRLPDSLRSVRDHFLSLDPTSLTVDLLEQHLLAAETSAVVMSLLLIMTGLLLQVRSAAAARARVARVVEVAAVVVEVAAGVVVGAAVEVVAAVGLVKGVGALVAAVEAAVGVAAVAAMGLVAVGLELRVMVPEVASVNSSSVGARPSHPSSFTCGRLHTQHRCFSRLDDAWRAEFGDDVQLPRWADLLRSRIAIFDLDFDAILSAMYALSVSAEGDCYRCVPPDPGIAAAALGASESGTLPVRLADPCWGPVLARSSTVLPCSAVLPGSLSGLHLPSLSANLEITAALQDAMVTTTTPGGQRVTICTCTRTGCHLATFTRRPGSSLYTLATEPPHVAASAQVSASGQVAASCLCCLLSHQTLLWHHRLGHPSLPRLRGMHSRLLVSGLPRPLPPLPPSPAPPCLPCVEGQQRAAPHSSSFPPTSATLQTLHMDVWGPARVSGQSREHNFLLVVDDYTRYTTVFPLRSKGQVVDVLIPSICTVHLQLRERFGQDLPILRLHSDRDGEFSSKLLRDICRGEGILQSFTLPDSPQQNGIAERRIGLVMKVARTSMIHAAAPHFLWPFAVRYSAHQLNLWPRVSLPETSPTLRWTGEVGDASVFRGLAPSGVSHVDPLPGRARVQVVVGSGVAPNAASEGAASGGAASEGAESEGAGSRGAEPGGEEPVGVEPAGAEPGGAESEGAESGGGEPRGAALSGGPAGASLILSLQQLREWFVRRTCLRSRTTGARGAGAPGAGGTRFAAAAGVTGGTAVTCPGGARTRGTGAAGTGGVEGAGARDPTESGATGAGGSGAGGVGAGGARVGGTNAGGAGVGGPGVGGAGAGGAGAVDPGGASVVSLRLVLSRLFALLVVFLVRVLLLSPARTLWHFVLPLFHFVFLYPQSDYARAASPTIARLLATAVKDPSFESRAASALVAELLDFAVACQQGYATALIAESASAIPPSVGDISTPRSYAEAITGPYSSQWQAAMDAEMASWKSTGTYVDEVPPLGANIVDGMWIFRVKRPPGSPLAFKARYVARGFSQGQGVDYFETFSPTPKMTTLRVLLPIAAQRDYELHSLDFSIAFLQGSLHEEIWLRRPPGFTESFPAGTQWSLRRLVYSLRQAPREWHDTLRTTLAALGFDPTTANPSLFLRTDTSLPPFYVLVYIDDLVFAMADNEALTLVKSKLQKRHTCTNLGELRSYLGLEITRDRARRTITLTRSHMVHQVLQRFGFQFSSPQPTPLSTSHLLSAPPSDESVESSGRGPVVLTGHSNAFWVDESATQRLSQGYTFSLGSGSVSWRSTRSSSVLNSSCEAEIYAGAMAAQELRWLTFLLTDLGEQPRLPPVLYVDNKAMIALC
ncbi:unnamed protein product [Closterium sp. NIES-54]